MNASSMRPSRRRSSPRSLALTRCGWPSTILTASAPMSTRSALPLHWPRRRAGRAPRQILEPEAADAAATSVYAPAPLHHPQLRQRRVDGRDRTESTAIHDERAILRCDQAPDGPLPPDASLAGPDGGGGAKAGDEL